MPVVFARANPLRQLADDARKPRLSSNFRFSCHSCRWLVTGRGGFRRDHCVLFGGLYKTAAACAVYPPPGAGGRFAEPIGHCITVGAAESTGTGHWAVQAAGKDAGGAYEGASGDGDAVGVWTGCGGRRVGFGGGEGETLVGREPLPGVGAGDQGRLVGQVDPRPPGRRGNVAN